MRRLRLLAALGAAVLGLHALLLVWFGERLRASTAPDPAIERLSAVYTREIAQSLSLSINTVECHAKNIYRKLAVRSRAGAVYSARAQGLLP